MSIKKRKYKSYNDYLAHQSDKLTKGISKRMDKFTLDKFNRRVKSFKKRFKEIKKYIVGIDVLCLGARLGEEVAALRAMGFDSCLGIDINPGFNNNYVVKGDFNNMPFDDESFETIFTNSIDHAWDLKVLSKEMARVIVPGGRLILEISHNKKGQKYLVKSRSKYESLMWDSPKEISKYFEEFKLVKKFRSRYKRLINVFDKK